MSSSSSSSSSLPSSSSSNPDSEKRLKQEAKETNEEYKIWKKNTPFLYDTLFSHALEWPSLTVEWVPGSKTISPNSNYSTQKVVIGTHAAENEQNHLIVADVHIPFAESKQGANSLVNGPRIEISQIINHQGEVNRARCMPQNPSFIATKTNSSEIHIFNTTSQPKKAARTSPVSPLIRLVGHEAEGYGLNWSILEEGLIVSGSDDHLVCLWDVKSLIQQNAAAIVKPVLILRGHDNVVEDVQFHPLKRFIVASCGDDKNVCIWDTRTTQNPSLKWAAHNEEINSISFNPVHDYLLLTASNDKTVALWDTRLLDRANPQPIHTFTGHNGAVVQVAWSPSSETIFASCSTDRRVLMWDASQIGASQTEDEQKDGAPELLFIHGGHTDKVADFAWNPNEENMIASVSDDNLIQVWKPSSTVFEN